MVRCVVRARPVRDPFRSLGEGAVLTGPRCSLLGRQEGVDHGFGSSASQFSTSVTGGTSVVPIYFETFSTRTRSDTWALIDRPSKALEIDAEGQKALRDRFLTRADDKEK